MSPDSARSAVGTSISQIGALRILDPGWVQNLTATAGCVL